MLSKFKGSSLKHCQIISFLVLKVMVTLTMTLSTEKCQLLVRTNMPSKFEGHSPKHCQVIKHFSTKGPGALYLFPQDHLLVRTDISTKFEGLFVLGFYGPVNPMGSCRARSV